MELFLKVIGLSFGLLGLIKNFVNQDFLDKIDNLLRDSLEEINTDIGSYFFKSLKVTIWLGKGIFTLWFGIFLLGVIATSFELVQTIPEDKLVLPNSIEEGWNFLKKVLSSDSLVLWYDIGKFAIVVVLMPFIAMQIITVVQLLVITLLKFPKGVLEGCGFILAAIGFYDEVFSLLGFL